MRLSMKVGKCIGLYIRCAAKSILTSILIFMISFGFSYNVCAQEQITISTYYPSPVGVYQQLAAEQIDALDDITNPRPGAVTDPLYVRETNLQAIAIDNRGIMSRYLENGPLLDGDTGASWWMIRRTKGFSIRTAYFYNFGAKETRIGEGDGTVKYNLGVGRALIPGVSEIDYQGARLEYTNAKICGIPLFGAAYAFANMVAIVGAGLVSYIIAAIIAQLLSLGWDLAEDFPMLNGNIEAADVVVIDEESGKCKLATQPYDKNVVGVISSDPAFVLGNTLDNFINKEEKLRQDLATVEDVNVYHDRVKEFYSGYSIDKVKEHLSDPTDGKQPVALAGTAMCKVDASYGAIKAGDLLTTSNTPGHAMKATVDSFEKIGTVLAKALEPFSEGKGVIKVLIMQR